MFVTEHVQSSSDKALQNFHENHRSMIVLTAISMRFSKTFFVGRFLTFKKKSSVNLFELLAPTCVLL